MRQSHKNHYVPKFYLKRWAQNNPDHKLFSGRYFSHKNKVEWVPHAPSGTGYEVDLYGEIEETFFKPLDNDASKILNKVESKSSVTPIKFDLGEEGHKRWAEFILGFIVRTPNNVEFIQEGFPNISVARNEIPKIIQDKRANQDLRSLIWIFARVDSNLELITCDNPLIFKPNNLSHPKCVIILPMSPMHFFIAAKKENIDYLETDPRKMVKHINAAIIKNADKRIYAKSRYSIEDSFVIKHWNKENDLKIKL